MFNVTPAAARQIGTAASQGGSEGLALRIEAKHADDGSIGYRIGFDEIKGSDTHIMTGGVDVVFAEASKPLLQGATLDYVEMQPGQFAFIVLNPNDPHFVAPDAEAAG